MNRRGNLPATELSSFARNVYAACSLIPKGKVATYAWIATQIGKPGAARAVGNALNKNPHGYCDPRPTTGAGKRVPCHRVIASDGSIGGFAHGTQRKIELLATEGVHVRQGKVDASRVLGKGQKRLRHT